MASGNISIVASLAGVSVQSTITRTDTGQISHEVSLDAGKAGTLSTRTSASQGTATLASGHGIGTGDVVDVYWTGGVRYGMTVGTVDGTSVPLTNSGAGDDLPAEDASIVVAPVVTVDTDFDGDLMAMLMVHSTKRGHANFRDGTQTSLKAREMLANEAYVWAEDTGEDNPLTGNAVDDCRISNGDSSAAATFKIGVLYTSST